MRLRPNHRYKISKAIYALLIIIAFPIDIVFASRLSMLMDDYLPSWAGLPLSGFLVAIIGVGSYLLYLWQIEHLTKK